MKPASFGLHSFAALCGLAVLTEAVPTFQKRQDVQCQRTQVAIIGAGTTGLTAAQALTNASITNFTILEYLPHIGGRVAHTTFGARPDGTPYIIELGANWVQGLGTPPDGPENPIWTLAQKWGLNNTYSNYSSLRTYNETGEVGMSELFDAVDEAYTQLEQDAGSILTENLQDRSVRAGFSIAGWKPGRSDMASQAVEWWTWDFEYSYPPELSSQLFGIVNYNTTFYLWSEENNFVWDQRGFSYMLEAESGEFLGEGDPRLLLSTVVSNVTYSDEGVTVWYNDSQGCVQADYAINTVSIGVLQAETITFDPPLPDWKTTAINTFQMGTYTKIFLQWPSSQIFWPTDTQFFLYADPLQRGYYPIFQSLSSPDFFPDSGILFVTVVNDQSYRVERMDDQLVMEEVMAVLGRMFGPENVPRPYAFLVARWSDQPWAFGSYSNWPPGMTLEMHQNLRANVGRLFFAGEATSAEWYGFLQGAWYEGQAAGQTIAMCLNGTGGDGRGYETRYEVLHGTTEPEEYNATNGWVVSSFETFGFEE